MDLPPVAARAWAASSSGKPMLKSCSISITMELELNSASGVLYSITIERRDLEIITLNLRIPNSKMC